MADLRYTRRVLLDLAEIYEKRSFKSAQTAQRIEDHLEQSIRSLALRPRSGVAIAVDSVRRWPLTRYRYTVFFRYLEDQEIVEVLRVVPSSRVRNLNDVPEE